MRVVVSRDGAPIADETFRPAYQGREAWGEGCGVCTQATVKLKLPQS